MKTSKYLTLIFLVGMMLLLTTCSEDNGINLFSPDDDISFGATADKEIRNNLQDYAILDSSQNVAAYQHLYRIRNAILASGKLTFSNRFSWRCAIIKSDTTINAFCLPGGYMYFYTGIIKFLDNEAQFAGVMAHEMAHADRRHTTEQLTTQYGIDLLLGIILGNNEDQLTAILTDYAKGLGMLAYSRQMEYEADKYAVSYIYPTEYDASCLGDFFQKMQEQPHPPAFLSTHPSPEDRLDRILEEFNALGGVHGQKFESRYQEFINSLP